VVAVRQGERARRLLTAACARQTECWTTADRLDARRLLDELSIPS
jgi:hypothetical protein